MKSRSKVVQTGQRIMAGMLSSHTFSPERIEEWNRKIKNGRFYSKNESLLEQVKEKNVSLMRCIKKIAKACESTRKAGRKNASGFENVYEWMR